MNRDHPDFWKAVSAAMIDDDRAAWVPPHPESRPHEGFTRAHVELLRDCGCTRADVLDYARQFLNPAQVAKLDADLPSYGIT